MFYCISQILLFAYIKQVSGHHLSNSLCSLHVSVSHFVNSCNISNFSIIIIFVKVICDQWSLMFVIILGHHEPCLYNTANLTDKCCVCMTTPPMDCFLISLLSYSLTHNIEICPINNPTMVSKCSSERMSHTSLTLSQKLEMISLERKACQKSWKAESQASCIKQPSYEYKEKVLERNWKCYSRE